VGNVEITRAVPRPDPPAGDGVNSQAPQRLLNGVCARQASRGAERGAKLSQQRPNLCGGREPYRQAAEGHMAGHARPEEGPREQRGERAHRGQGLQHRDGTRRREGTCARDSRRRAGPGHGGGGARGTNNPRRAASSAGGPRAYNAEATRVRGPGGTAVRCCTPGRPIMPAAASAGVAREKALTAPP
jgi:hypothetical protein